MSARDHNVERILSGETLPELVPLDEHWRLAREGMDQRRQEAWERAQAQWFKRLNEGDANQQLQGFKPALVRHEEIEEILAPAKVLIGCAVFLAVCVAVAVAALNYWR